MDNDSSQKTQVIPYVFIAQNLESKSQNELVKERRHLAKVVERHYAHIFLNEHTYVIGHSSNHEIDCLLGNIRSLASSDVAVFSGDWQESRECRIFHAVALEYCSEVIESYSYRRDDD